MKIKIFTHIDLDGIGCAVLAYLVFGKENVDVEYCNYDDVDDKVEAFMENEDLYRSYDSIFITDISVSDQVASMIDCLDKVERTVRLFDHHGTALRLDSYFWCTVYEYLDAVKTSGTELFYLYLSNSLSLTYDQTTQNKISRFVSIVRDYDTWRWKELGEDGLVSKQMNDLFHIYGRDKFIELAIKRIMFGTSPLHQDEWFSETDTLLLEQKQKDIDIYVEQKEKQITVKTDQWGNTYGVIFAERYFSELGNRLCEIHPELAYIAMIDISRGTVSYRTIRDSINLGTEIAHNYGGGGHPKAAGSTFDILWAMDVMTDWLFGMQNAESETYTANVGTFENPVRISTEDFVKKYMTTKCPPMLSNASGSL
jgi:oligoribonuclease NrnB/cAMP/cGMP phosphodiesterase (DHH superfamily)